jgi:hypothetical protein
MKTRQEFLEQEKSQRESFSLMEKFVFVGFLLTMTVVLRRQCGKPLSMLNEFMDTVVRQGLSITEFTTECFVRKGTVMGVEVELCGEEEEFVIDFSHVPGKVTAKVKCSLAKTHDWTEHQGMHKLAPGKRIIFKWACEGDPPKFDEDEPSKELVLT